MHKVKVNKFYPKCEIINHSKIEYTNIIYEYRYWNCPNCNKIWEIEIIRPLFNYCPYCAIEIEWVEN